jgi:predicted O-methyltransferase YrrM
MLVIDKAIRFAIRSLRRPARWVSNLEARRFTVAVTPELTPVYAAFARAHQISAGRQPDKGRELWRLLDRYRPKFIAEMGSGTTSAVFALWARRNGARYIANESHPQWTKVTQESLTLLGFAVDRSTIRHIPSEQSQAATRFAEPIPKEADFVYIDGPPCRLDDGRNVANDDIIRLFDEGGLPATIVVDGRLETVDLIRTHPVSRRYRVEGSYNLAVRERNWLAALQFREHTVFRLQ